jgi:hypothetical protein
VAGPVEHCNKLSGTIKAGNFVLADIQLASPDDSAAWS